MTAPKKLKLKPRKAAAPAAAPTASTPAKTTANPAKKKKAKAVKQKPAPMERKAARGDRTYTVRLLPRHADWVELRAAQANRTVEQMLEKIVREGYAMDPNNKTGGTTNDKTQIGALAESKQQGAG